VPAPDHSMKVVSLDAYIAELDTALASLPAGDREEILLETRSHAAERMQRDPTMHIEDVLKEFGDPQTYALEFLPKRSQDADGPTLANVASVATNGWKSFPILLLVAAGYGIASLFVFIAIAKLIEPSATGWYVRTIGEHQSTGLVISDPNHGGRDVLGFWLVPIALGLAGAIHWLLSRLLRRVARKPSSL
jgi:hypothetical protein